MNVAYFAAAAYVTLVILVIIYWVGKPRRPLTGVDAVANLIILTPIIVLLVLAGIART